MNVDKICEEIIWYSKRDEKTNKFCIPIVIDFDFTITKESSWLKGTFTENDHCFDIMKKWENDFGVKFILETMRGEENIKPAIEFCKQNGIEFYGIGRNPLQDSGPGSSCKVWAIWSIDEPKRTGVCAGRETARASESGNGLFRREVARTARPCDSTYEGGYQ